MLEQRCLQLAVDNASLSFFRGFFGFAFSFQHGLDCAASVKKNRCCNGMIWEVQPSKTSSCHSQGLIDEVIRESRSPHVTHLPHVWDLLLAQHRYWYKAPSGFMSHAIDRLAEILLMKAI